VLRPGFLTGWYRLGLWVPLPGGARTAATITEPGLHVIQQLPNNIRLTQCHRLREPEQNEVKNHRASISARKLPAARQQKKYGYSIQKVKHDDPSDGEHASGWG
jgi:hypothetical protein